MDKKPGTIVKVFAIYAALAAFMLSFIGSSMNLGGFAGGHASLPNTSVEDFAEQYSKYGRVEFFKKQRAYKKMAGVTSHTEVHADAYMIIDALLDEDESTLMKMTEKYSAATPFAPAHFLGTGGSRTTLTYHKQKGTKATIEKLFSKDWNFLSGMKNRFKNNAKDRAKNSSELLADCRVSKHPEQFHNAAGTGLISKRTYGALEGEETAGPLTQVKGINGEDLLDTWGQPCLGRKAYAEEMQDINVCYHKATKRQLSFRYCYRSKEMQAVVKNVIQKNTTRCIEGVSKLARVGRFVQSAGGKKASPPAVSRHGYGVAFDIDTHVGKGALDKCMPEHWSELRGDPGHWEVKSPKISKLKPGECTTVITAAKRTRQFCKSKLSSTIGDSTSIPEGGYVRVPKGEIPDDELVRAKATPEIKEISEKIQNAEFKHISVQELLDGAWHVFRYNTSDGERFCKVEAHDNHKARGIVGFIRGQKSAGTALYNKGCSTFKLAS